MQGCLGSISVLDDATAGALIEFVLQTLLVASPFSVIGKSAVVHSGSKKLGLLMIALAPRLAVCFYLFDFA